MGLSEQLLRLDGKVALVTGGFGGIGAAVSRGLGAMGAKVAVTGNDAKLAAAFAGELEDQGCDSYATAFDVISVHDTERMVDQVANHFGRLDIFVNCVGLNLEEKAGEVTEKRFDYVLDVNLKNAMFQAQAARHMIGQGTGGKQVHIGSVRTLLALRGRGYAAYCASKGGLATMCKQLAAEWAPHKINVNVVARIPLGRIAEPDDVRNAVLFLVSPASDFITGQTIYLDGGITATQ